VEPGERLAIVAREIADAAVLERVVPALAQLRHDTLRDGVRHRALVWRTVDELDELRFRKACFGEQHRAQAGREVILAEVAAAQRRPRFVDRARQEHEPREPGTRIARRPPSQADRAHQRRS
jgi:hypothetical protein